MSEVHMNIRGFQSSRILPHPSASGIIMRRDLLHVFYANSERPKKRMRNSLFCFCLFSFSNFGELTRPTVMTKSLRHHASLFD